MVGLILLISCAGNARAADRAKPTLLKTTTGVEFGLLGAKPAAPAPTLFVFANDINTTLADPAYNKVGQLLAQQGYLCVTLDAPAHGKDADPKHPSELSAWRERIEHGDDLVAGFTSHCAKVLDYLIAEGYTDPNRVAAAGTSRGGFLALHFAAADPRVRCVVGFAPVTNLMALSEFAGMTTEPAARALSLVNVADKLVGRPIWVCIGNDDRRVSTDDAIAFTRTAVRSAVDKQKPAAIELHVTTSQGHSVHPTAHAEAAGWIAARVSEAAIQQVGDRTCLFLDDRFIAEQKGLTRTWRQARPLPQPAITGDAWDQWPHLFGSAIFDPQEKLYRMWYSSIREGIFYAESRDGRIWSKPNLRLHDLDGSKDNNFVMPRVSLPNVLLDPNEKDPAGRFKLFAWDHSYYDKEPKEDRADGHTLFRSPDGVHWEPIGKGVPGSLMAPEDRCSNFITPDTNQVIRDPLAERYLATFRTYPKRWENGEFEPGRRRAIGVTSALQITGPWQPIVTQLVPDELDDKAAAAAMQGVPAGPKWAEFYAMPLFVYGNHYIGLLSLIHVARDAAGMQVANAIGGGDLQLAFSNDGMKWQRPSERKTLIAPSDATDLHPTYAACSAPLEMGDEIWIYYAEANSSHPTKDSPKSQIRAAAWRKDGFVSLDSTLDVPGTLTTPPLRFAGAKLLLNCESGKGGFVRVELQAADGSPLKGFEETSCDAMPGDSIAKPVSWQGKTDVSSLRDTPLRIKIVSVNSRVYSFRFAM